MTLPLCHIQNLGITYPKQRTPALTDINLEIYARERLAIIGESGSGKTTLARSLAGLLPQGAKSSGSIDWALHGKRIKARPQAGRELAYVFQDPGSSLNPVLKIGEQVAETAHQHLDISYRQALRQAVDLLERVQLPEPQRLVNAYPHQLSGGQKQRVAIAAAIAAQPSILIADEATSALDSVTQAAIARLLDGLVQEEGMTLIFITHDIALASSLADRIAVLQSGRLVEQGRASEVINSPEDPYTRELISAHIDLSTPPLVLEPQQ
ncbi:MULTISPECIES: ABC transporter ATP-binding protein [Rhizobium/Agrobacterium group]|jgi:peptide/nickel transport system ATP-binding protein|uniref:ABC transporter ATP-binding protein n=1 Tax=Rhizobium/Agrobacterium group TaxID=227290 RepID=UPI00216A80E3|nr:ABC transporter ATP-binding protein [Rhizobium sp. BIGb0125]MCS4243300.1 peptide/nickel transport system ATP-binding protein [Rhizobium sp. BIGb0125]